VATRKAPYGALLIHRAACWVSVIAQPAALVVVCAYWSFSGNGTATDLSLVGITFNAENFLQFKLKALVCRRACPAACGSRDLQGGS
jgi:hypothetical protein